MGLALLLHALLLGAAVYGWRLFRSPPHPMPSLAIEATVVDARTVAAASRPVPPPPVPQESPPEPQGPPPPTPEERAQREQQRAQEREKAEAAAAQQAAEEKEQAAQAKAAEEQHAAEAKRKTAEAKAAQEKKAQEAQQAKAKAEDAQEEAEREADLQRSLASEERTAAVSSGPALASWQAQIAARINHAWLRPPTARPGIQCMLYVTQEPGGAVTQVKIGDCNGDQAVRESIEAAVYRASPLPPPPDPALFDRNLKINFKPD
ncbi:MAG TPA: cell envelope integrity protein TolA [Steroidobacteraceae bacterium]